MSDSNSNQVSGLDLPFHQEHSRHKSMCDQYTDAREFVRAKLPPEALIETRDAIVGISRAFAVGYSVEEVTIIGTFRPHALHFGRTWLEVPEILFSQAWFLVDFDFVPTEWAWWC